MQRKVLLLHAVGGNSFDIFKSLADHGTTYNHAKAALISYFKRKVNKEYERAVFRRRRQETGETIDVYHTRLHKTAASLRFHGLRWGNKITRHTNDNVLEASQARTN